MTTCDRCPAKSLVVVSRQDGLTLEFCGHHHNQYEIKLFIDGFRVEANPKPEAVTTP